MLTPVRCFTCNRIIADEKLHFFEKHRFKTYEEVIKLYTDIATKLKKKIDTLNSNQQRQSQNIIVLEPLELKDEYKFNPSLSNEQDYFNVSPSTDFHILNILGVDKICCRRMYLSYVDMLDKIN